MRISVIPVYMPPPISTPIRRLAVVQLYGPSDDRLTSWLDLTLNFLRSRHPELTLVEREKLGTVLNEIWIQHTGRVDDATMVRIGKLTGADSLLLHRLSVVEGQCPVSVSFELRMVEVQHGTTLFRQITTAMVSPVVWAGIGAASRKLDPGAGHLAIEAAAAYGLAALKAVLRDNPLGIVPDANWREPGMRLLGVLRGSPGYQAGLREGDRILASKGRPLRAWADPITLPADLTIKRDSRRLELSVGEANARTMP